MSKPEEKPILHPCQVCINHEEGTDEDGDWLSCSESDCNGMSKWAYQPPKAGAKG